MKRLAPILILLLLWVFVEAGQTQETVGTFSRLLLGGVAGAGTVDVRTGTGTPESTVVGTVGDVFIRTNCVSSGTCFYVKESGTGNTGWIAPATGNSATTFLEKTLDAEGSGNLITSTYIEWFNAAICQNTTPSTDWNLPTSNPAVAACQTGSNTQFGTLNYADGASLSAQFTKRIPGDRVGNTAIDLSWFTAAIAGSVVWQVSSACTSGGGVVDPTFATASTVIDVADGTTNRLNSAVITSLTMTGCSAGSQQWIRVLRDSAHASDSLADTARLIGIQMTYRRAI